MRVRWLGLAALVVAVGAGAASGAMTKPVLAEAPEAYVDVQFNTGVTVQSLNPDGSSPTLAEQGFRLLPVPRGMTASEYLAELRTRPDVLSAEPSIRVRAAEMPNDPYYSSGSPTQAQYLTQIGAPEAWDLATGSGQVLIAVIDSGTDLGHPDLVGRIWENPIDNRGDGIDRDGNGKVNDRYGWRFVSVNQVNRAVCGYTDSQSPNVSDDWGTGPGNLGSHGTLVAGIIAAAGNNGLGVAGVSWNTRIMTVKTLDCQGEGEMANVAQGIEYAVRNGARIINISIAATGPQQNGDSPSMRAAMQAAQNAGVIVVAAAGNHIQPNDPVGTRYPAAYLEYPNLIAVGASDNLNGNQWASYSNYGPAVDFAAPANRIVSTVRSDLVPQNPYAEVGDTGGTSFAAPFVTGMFALMMARNSRLTPAEYIQIARDSATAAAPAPHGQNWAGAGILNIGKAVARVPMSISGSPLHDWRDVPAGTVIEAFIDGSLCGTTRSDAFGLVGRYDIRVKSQAEQPNCGQPGKMVQLSVGGAPAQPTIPWSPPNQDLGLRDRDISSVSPPPGAIVVQTLNGAWSNIAHLEPGGELPGAAASLPTPWNSIFRWDPLKKLLDRPGAYRRFFRGVPSFANDYPTIVQYDAYWTDAPASKPGSINPQPAPGRTIELHPGWNNFTYTGTSRQVSDALLSVAGKYTQVLQFDNATGEWQGYDPSLAQNQRYLNDFGGLFALKVYWVFMKTDGSLVMN